MGVVVLSLSQPTKDWADDTMNGWYKHPSGGSWSKPNSKYSIRVGNGGGDIVIFLQSGQEDIAFIYTEKPYNKEELIQELMDYVEFGKTISKGDMIMVKEDNNDQT